MQPIITLSVVGNWCWCAVCSCVVHCVLVDQTSNDRHKQTDARVTRPLTLYESILVVLGRSDFRNHRGPEGPSGHSTFMNLESLRDS